MAVTREEFQALQKEYGELHKRLTDVKKLLADFRESCPHNDGTTNHAASCAGYRKLWTTCNICGKQLTASYPDDDPDEEP